MDAKKLAIANQLGGARFISSCKFRRWQIVVANGASIRGFLRPRRMPASLERKPVSACMLLIKLAAFMSVAMRYNPV